MAETGSDLIVRRRSALLGILVVALMLAPHVAFLDNGYVDVEPLYVDAGVELAEHGLDGNLQPYYKAVGNPLLTSVVLGVGYRIFGESPFLSRTLILILSLSFIPIMFVLMKRIVGPDTSFVALLLIIVNPAFIVYSQYIHSEGLFFGLTSVSILLLLARSDLRRWLPSSIIMGLALAAKFVTVAVLPVVAIWSMIRNSPRFWRDHSIAAALFAGRYLIVTVGVALPILLLAYHFQGSLLSNELASRHAVNPTSMLRNLFSYILWLGLFAGIGTVIVAQELLRKYGLRFNMLIISGLVVLNLLLAVYIPFSALYEQGEAATGEMSLGWLQEALGPKLTAVFVFMVLVVGEYVIAGLILYARTSVLHMTLAYWVVVPLFLMSFTRPANRYVLAVVVPLAIFIALLARRSETQSDRRRVVWILVLHSAGHLAAGVYSNWLLMGRGA